MLTQGLFYHRNFNSKSLTLVYKSLYKIPFKYPSVNNLTHWGRVTHICVSKLTIIGSDNGLSPGRRQAIIWTNDGILLIRTFQTHFSEIVSEIHTFSCKKIHWKMSSGKWRPFCLGHIVLKHNCSFSVTHTVFPPDFFHLCSPFIVILHYHYSCIFHQYGCSEDFHSQEGLVLFNQV